MQKFIFFIISFILSLSISGQVLTDRLTGKPYQIKPYNEIEGSIYLFDEWKLSDITDNKSTTFHQVMIKFDAFANEFVYNRGDTTFNFITVVNEVKMFPVSGDTLTKIIFKKGFTISDKITPDKFVQVLTEGKVTAIKYIYKTIEEKTAYNMPGGIKNFADRATYCFIRQEKFFIQKPNPKLIEELLKDKWLEINYYIKQNHLTTKNEEDCIKIINYYNTL